MKRTFIWGLQQNPHFRYRRRGLGNGAVRENENLVVEPKVPACTSYPVGKLTLNAEFHVGGHANARASRTFNYLPLSDSGWCCNR